MTGADRYDLVVTVQEAAPAGWDDFLPRAVGTSFFHCELWTRAVCHQESDIQSVWVVARRSGRLLGGLVAVRRRLGWGERIDSHHDGTTGGPAIRGDLAEEEQDTVFAALLARYARLRGVGTLVLSLSLSADSAERFGPLAHRAGWRAQPVPAAILPLDGGLAHVERYVFKKNRRNERNRSLKHGCVSGVTTDAGILAEYYPVYRESARRWGITPTPPGLLRELLTAGEGRVFLSYVRHEGQVIGGHLNLHWGDRVTAWNGATLPEHNDKFPATLLIWTDIEEACRREALQLDLGGSGGISSLANFKKLLGAQEEIRQQFELTSPLYRWLRRGRQLWRRRGGRQ